MLMMAFQSKRRREMFFFQTLSILLLHSCLLMIEGRKKIDKLVFVVDARKHLEQALKNDYKFVEGHK